MRATLRLLPALLLLASAASAGTPAERIATRAFPSVFEAWNGAENLFDNGVETPTAPQGRAELSRMREVTTLALTLSDGYALYADRNRHKVDHAHDWYTFWRARLGRPTQPPRKVYDAPPFRREFERGTALFNPPEAAPATIRFAQDRISAATGQRGRVFTLAPADGDLFLRP